MHVRKLAKPRRRALRGSGVSLGRTGDKVVVLRGLNRTVRVVGPTQMPQTSDAMIVSPRWQPARLRPARRESKEQQISPESRACTRIRTRVTALSGLQGLGGEFETRYAFLIEPFPTGGSTQPAPIFQPPQQISSDVLDLHVSVEQVGPFTKLVGATQVTIRDTQYREDAELRKVVDDAVREAVRLGQDHNLRRLAPVGRWFGSDGTTKVSGKKWCTDASARDILPDGTRGPKLSSDNWWKRWQDVLTPDQVSAAHPTWKRFGRYSDLVFHWCFPGKNMSKRVGDDGGSSRCWRGMCVEGDGIIWLPFFYGVTGHMNADTGTTGDAYSPLPTYKYRSSLTGKRMGVFIERRPDRFVFHFREVEEDFHLFSWLWSSIKELASKVIETVGKLFRAIVDAIVCTAAKSVLSELVDVANRKGTLSASGRSKLLSAGVSTSTIALLTGGTTAVSASVVTEIGRKLTSHFCKSDAKPECSTVTPCPSGKECKDGTCVETKKDEGGGIAVTVGIAAAVGAGLFFLAR